MEAMGFYIFTLWVAAVPLAGAIGYLVDGWLQKKLTRIRWMLAAIAAAILFALVYFQALLSTAVVVEVCLWVMLALLANVFDWPRVAGCVSGLLMGFGCTMWAGYFFFLPLIEADMAMPVVWAAFLLAVPVSIASAWLGWKIGTRIKRAWPSTFYGLAIGCIVGLLLTIATSFSPAHHPIVEDTAATPAPGEPAPDELAR